MYLVGWAVRWEDLGDGAQNLETTAASQVESAHIEISAELAIRHLGTSFYSLHIKGG